MSKKKVQIRIDKTEWQVIEDAHEPLIEKELYYAAQRILHSRSHSRAPRRAYHPLTGILKCGKCNEGMVCQKRSGNGKEYRYYICKTYHKYGREACDQANVNADELEAVITNQIREKLALIPDGMLSIVANKENDIKRLEEDGRMKQLRKEKMQKDQIDIFHQRGLFDTETYETQMLELKRQINFLEQELEIIEKPRPQKRRPWPEETFS